MGKNSHTRAIGGQAVGIVASQGFKADEERRPKGGVIYAVALIGRPIIMDESKRVRCFLSGCDRGLVGRDAERK